MDKHEVIAAYCLISAQVAEGVFKYKHAADCFCGMTQLCTAWHYQYEDAVLDYVRTAVHEKMQREGHTIHHRIGYAAHTTRI
jgi:hypothetical protein